MSRVWSRVRSEVKGVGKGEVNEEETKGEGEFKICEIKGYGCEL